jgi:hypothetical protein
MAYLRDDKMQILCSALDLIADIREFNLASGFQALFNWHLEDPILGTLLARRLIVRLTFNLELLHCAVVKLLQAHSQRLLHNRDFRLWCAPSTSESSAFSSTAAHSSRHPAHTEATKIKLVAAAAAAGTAVTHKFAEYVVRVGEIEAVSAAAGREVERSTAPGHPTTLCERETSSATGPREWVTARPGIFLWMWYAAS